MYTEINDMFDFKRELFFNQKPEYIEPFISGKDRN